MAQLEKHGRSDPPFVSIPREYRRSVNWVEPRTDSSVAVMQPADHGLGNDPAKLLDRAADRRVLPQREVSSRLVVVSRIRGHDPAKVCLAEHDRVVDAL